MPLYFWEERDAIGRWSPVTGPSKPTLKRVAFEGVERIVKVTGGFGPQARGVVEVPEKLAGLSLDELQVIYGVREPANG